MKGINYAIFLVFFTTILTSTAQVLYKFGINNVIKIGEEIVSPGIQILNYHIGYLAILFILIGLILYALGAVIMIIAFKHGEVTVLYPIIATSYIWVSIGGLMFFNEIMNIWKWLGVFAIVMGVTIISYGSKKEEAITYTEGV